MSIQARANLGHDLDALVALARREDAGRVLLPLLGNPVVEAHGAHGHWRPSMYESNSIRAYWKSASTGMRLTRDSSTASMCSRA